MLGLTNSGGWDPEILHRAAIMGMFLHTLDAGEFESLYGEHPARMCQCKRRAMECLERMFSGAAPEMSAREKRDLVLEMAELNNVMAGVAQRIVMGRG